MNASVNTLAQYPYNVISYFLIGVKAKLIDAAITKLVFLIGVSFRINKVDTYICCLMSSTLIDKIFKVIIYSFQFEVT